MFIAVLSVLPERTRKLVACFREQKHELTYEFNKWLFLFTSRKIKIIFLFKLILYDFLTMCRAGMGTLESTGIESP